MRLRMRRPGTARRSPGSRPSGDPRRPPGSAGSSVARNRDCGVQLPQRLGQIDLAGAVDVVLAVRVAGLCDARALPRREVTGTNARPGFAQAVAIEWLLVGRVGLRGG